MCSLGGMAVIRKNRNRARKYTEKLFNAFLAMGLVLIGFTGTLVSLVSIHSLRANEIESGQKLLTQFSNSVDTTLSYINTIMLNYSSNRKFRSFLLILSQFSPAGNPLSLSGGKISGKMSEPP